MARFFMAVSRSRCADPIKTRGLRASFDACLLLTARFQQDDCIARFTAAVDTIVLAGKQSWVTEVEQTLTRCTMKNQRAIFIAYTLYTMAQFLVADQTIRSALLVGLAPGQCDADRFFAQLTFITIHVLQAVYALAHFQPADSRFTVFAALAWLDLNADIALAQLVLVTLFVQKAFNTLAALRMAEARVANIVGFTS